MLVKMVDDSEFRRWKEWKQKSGDLSRKGAIDAAIVGLIELINGRDEYFTTSSCSGRIVVLEQVTSFSI